MNVAALRQDLALHSGPRSGDGSPTWTIQDPARNRFFRLDWLTFEILCHWELGVPAQIAAAVRRCTPLDASEADVRQVERFLQGNELVMQVSPEHAANLAKAADANAKSLLLRLVHNYLFFRVPLLNPEPLLDWLVAHTQWVFSVRMLWLMIALAVIDVHLIFQHWSELAAHVDYSFSWDGLLMVGAAGIFSKVFHEFGHGLHGLLSQVRFPRLSGTSVLRDFVEFPSQVYENWLMQPAILKEFAVHAETGHPMPDALIQKILEAQTFNQGFSTVEYVSSALVDLALHETTDLEIGRAHV